MNFKLLGMATLCVFAAGAQAYVIDFEDQTATSSSFVYPGGASMLNITVGAENIDVYRLGNEDFDVTDNTTMGSMPAAWGSRSLAPFVSGGTDDWFVFDFLNTAITEFSVQAGDYGGDADMISWQAYDGLGGTGNLVGSGSMDYGTNSLPTYLTVFGYFSGNAQSVLVRGGNSTFPNSVFIDNFSTQAVPEPATMTILGLAAVAALRKRKRS